MQTHINMLILADQIIDAATMVRALEHSGFEPHWAQITSEADYRMRLSPTLDLILTNDTLPQLDIPRALAIRDEQGLDVPLVVVSDTLSAEMAITMVAQGAADYVRGDHLACLGITVAQAIRSHHTRVEQRQLMLQLQSLSHQLIRAQEDERRRIAAELHDEIGSQLVALQLNLHLLQRSVGDSQGAGRLLDSIAILGYLTRQVRTLSRDLRPALLDELGLTAALRWYLERQAERTGLIISFAPPGGFRRVSAEIELTCFRIIQEALSNIVHHAQAAHVTVELRLDADHLELIVSDDGVGFEPALARARSVEGVSLGLLSMQERALLAGGKVEIESAPGAGATVSARFPLARGAAPVFRPSQISCMATCERSSTPPTPQRL